MPVKGVVKFGPTNLSHITKLAMFERRFPRYLLCVTKYCNENMNLNLLSNLIFSVNKRVKEIFYTQSTIPPTYFIYLFPVLSQYTSYMQNRIGPLEDFSVL